MLRDLTEKEEWDSKKDQIVSLMLLDNQDNPIWLKQIREQIEKYPLLLNEKFYYRGQSNYTLLDIAVVVGNPYLVNAFLPHFPLWKDVISNQFYFCLTGMNNKHNFPIIQNLVESFYHIEIIKELPKESLVNFMQNCFTVENRHLFNLATNYFIQNCEPLNHPDLPIMLVNTLTKDTLKTIVYEDYLNYLWKIYDVDYVNMAGKNILNLAIEKHDFSLALYLIDQQASIDYINPQNMNSFELFFKHISEENISYMNRQVSTLLDTFIDVFMQDYKKIKEPERFFNVIDKIKNYENLPMDMQKRVLSYYYQLNQNAFFEKMETLRFDLLMSKSEQKNINKKIKI